MADESVQTEAQTTTEATSTGTTSGADQTQSTETSSNTDGDDNVDLSKAPDKGADDKGDKGDKDGGDEPNELLGAPPEGEEYEITGLPEGMEVDKELLSEATPLLRGLNASPAAASQLASLVAKQVEKAVNVGNEQLEQSIVARRAEWETEARDLLAGKAEPLKNGAGDTLSFDGKTQKEVMAISARVIDKHAPEGFREFLEQTGLGVHPAMVTLMYQVGKGIAEDRDFEEAPTTSDKKKSTTEKFFGR